MRIVRRRVVDAIDDALDDDRTAVDESLGGAARVGVELAQDFVGRVDGVDGGRQWSRGRFERNGVAAANDAEPGFPVGNIERDSDLILGFRDDAPAVGQGPVV